MILYSCMSPVPTGLLFLRKFNKTSMLDLKTFKSALEQLEEEQKNSKEKYSDAIEQAMAAANTKIMAKRTNHSSQIRPGNRQDGFLP